MCGLGGLWLGGVAGAPCRGVGAEADGGRAAMGVPSSCPAGELPVTVAEPLHLSVLPFPRGKIKNSLLILSVREQASGKRLEVSPRGSPQGQCPSTFIYPGRTTFRVSTSPLCRYSFICRYLCPQVWVLP